MKEELLKKILEEVSKVKNKKKRKRKNKKSKKKKINALEPLQNNKPNFGHQNQIGGGGGGIGGTSFNPLNQPRSAPTVTTVVNTPPTGGQTSNHLEDKINNLGNGIADSFNYLNGFINKKISGAKIELLGDKEQKNEEHDYKVEEEDDNVGFEKSSYHNPLTNIKHGSFRAPLQSSSLSSVFSKHSNFNQPTNISNSTNQSNQNDEISVMTEPSNMFDDGNDQLNDDNNQFDDGNQLNEFQQQLLNETNLSEDNIIKATSANNDMLYTENDSDANSSVLPNSVFPNFEMTPSKIDEILELRKKVNALGDKNDSDIKFVKNKINELNNEDNEDTETLNPLSQLEISTTQNDLSDDTSKKINDNNNDDSFDLEKWKIENEEHKEQRNKEEEDEKIQKIQKLKDYAEKVMRGEKPKGKPPTGWKDYFIEPQPKLTTEAIKSQPKFTNDNTKLSNVRVSKTRQKELEEEKLRKSERLAKKNNDDNVEDYEDNPYKKFYNR